MSRGPYEYFDESAEQPLDSAIAARVKLPAIFLLIYSLLCLLTFCLCVPVAVFMQMAAGDWDHKGDQERTTTLVVFAIAILVYAVPALLVAIGAYRMMSARSYGLAMTAAIISMIPCGACQLVGVPLGIWALIVLLDANVKASFR